MKKIIDRNIDNTEVLIRCIFVGDFKRNQLLQEENIIDKDVFIDTRPNVDVSLLRTRYYEKEECINRGKSIKNDFVGFLIFRKDIFDKTVKSHKLENSNDFDAKIISTPLDENFKVIPIETIVTIDTPINPGHADITYLNPGLMHNDENPNTAIRRFSRSLFKECKVCLDFSNFENHIQEIAK